jgi:trimeric autotransporter adhesin
VNFNTALGRRALFRTQGDQNTGLGFFSGSNLSNGGTNNIYIGNVGPVPIGTESSTIRIGTQTATIATIGNPPIESHAMPTHTATFIAGISGRPVVGNTVVVNANGKLGTATSSERFKNDIKPMDKASEAVLALKPVTFRYKAAIDQDRIPQFGLIAEEVEKVNPDLVVRDTEGKPYSVRYDAVNAMLLNEFLKEHRHVQEQDAIIARQQKQIEALTTGLQKVSAQLEVSKSAPQTAENNQ